MKVLFFINHGRLTKTVGGVEKVYSEFANELTRRGFDVCAVYNDEGDRSPIFPIDPKVRLVNLRSRSSRSFLLIVSKIWRETTGCLRKTFLAPLFPDFTPFCKVVDAGKRLDGILKSFRPDAVVTFFLADSRALFYKRPQVDFATIQTTHNQPRVFFDEASPRLLTQTLNRCDVVQVLLPSFVAPFRAVCSSKIAVVPNAVPHFAESVDVDRREREGAPRIIYVGRLERTPKQQHLAIEAFAKIADACPDWTLYFFGDKGRGGSYRRSLVALISQLGLENRVFLCPSTPNIKAELLKSDILAFPSAYEAFSLALTEAQSLGLPAVGFADAPSVNELIVDGENGFLATDVDDFAQKLKTLIDSKELRRRFGANAKKSVEKYEASKVWDAWEKLLRETVEKKRAQIADA